ncbi:hypothetical protein OVY01_22565 [Robbsia sp. Bb-Pol-6]|uniref:Septum formation-related domain-containing protein n=1 Tax=Robbsia betulipollinis TaxID=2981849 RepID=A0ABT3ZTN1_9BURK|nr:hypothetical protein [Robbsia betulipollinis]MCY0389926.1 hypothetical protein [Robbsia betulipollinis]
MKRIALLLAFSVTTLFGLAAQAATADACGPGSTPSGKSYSINGQDVPLLASPKAGAAKLINEKATALSHTTQYMDVDGTTTVTEQCTMGIWSRVQVTDPEWLSDTYIGWIPTQALRKPQVDAKGVKIYTEADFLFDDVTRPYKKDIIDGVNRIHRENARCGDIDPTSAYITSESTKARPAFYVTCGKGAKAFNVNFTVADVRSSKQFEAPTNIDHGRAIGMCEDYAKAHAAHPSTVDFARLLAAVSDGANGNTRVRSTFTARNSYNTKLKYDITCLFNSAGSIEANINEAR